MIDEAVGAEFEEEETSHESAGVEEDIVVTDHLAGESDKISVRKAMALSCNEAALLLSDPLCEGDRHDCFVDVLL